MHEAIEATHRNIAHIDASILLTLEVENTVLFDVRETVEFKVSHLIGAIQLDPKINPEEFKSAYSHLLLDKTVVFYCSVGKRSSALASRLQNVIIDSGAIDVFNLIGGIFNGVTIHGHWCKGTPTRPQKYTLTTSIGRVTYLIKERSVMLPIKQQFHLISNNIRT